MKRTIIRPTIIITLIVVLFLTMEVQKVNYRLKMVTQFILKRKETYQDVWTNTNRSLTVVTAFFYLGKFPKGSVSNIRTPESYKVWMSVYKYLKNPLIIYTDSKKFADFLQNYETIQHLPQK